MLNLNFQNGQAPALNARNMNAIVESINTLSTQIASPFTFVGVVADTTDLPSAGNTVNDTYYVSNDTCLYSWNGSDWEQSSMNESDYLALIQALQHSIATDYSSASTYNVGDYCVHDGQMYKCTTEISAAETWTSGHWTVVNAGDELLALNKTKDKTNKAIRDLSGVIIDCNLELGSINTTTGNEVASSDGSRMRSNWIEIKKSVSFTITNGTANNITLNFCYYDASKTYLGYLVGATISANSSVTNVASASDYSGAYYVRVRLGGNTTNPMSVDNMGITAIDLQAGALVVKTNISAPGLDLDSGDFLHSGIWLLTSMTNAPANYPSSYVGRIVCLGTNSSYTTGRIQMVFDSNKDVYFRSSFTSGTWNSWKKIPDQDAIESKTPYDHGKITTAGLDLNTGDFIKSGIWSVVDTSYLPKHCPTTNPCRIYVFSSSTSSTLYTWQTIKDNTGQTFTRFSPLSSTWSDWTHEIPFHEGISFPPVFASLEVFISDNNNITQDEGSTGRVSRLYAMYDAITETGITISKESLGLDESNTYNIYNYKVRNTDNSTTKPIVLLIFGEHGDELNSAMVGPYVYQEIVNGCLSKYLTFVDFWVIPLMNPWGYENEQRNNSNDVNLNRDFPCQWTYSTVQHNKTAEYSLSQVETQYIYNLIVNNRDNILFLLNKHDTDTIYAKIEAGFEGVVGYCSTMMSTDYVINNGVAMHESAQIKSTDSWIMGYTGTDMSAQKLISSRKIPPVGSLDLFANSIGVHGSLLEVAYRAGNPAYGTPHLKELARLSLDFVCNWISASIENNKTMLSSDNMTDDTVVVYYTRTYDSGTQQWVLVEQYWDGTQLVDV